MPFVPVGAGGGARSAAFPGWIGGAAVGPANRRCYPTPNMGSTGLRQGTRGASGAASVVCASLFLASLLTGCFGGPKPGSRAETTSCEGPSCPTGTIVTPEDVAALRNVRVLRGALVIRPGQGAQGSASAELQHLDSLASLEEVGS